MLSIAEYARFYGQSSEGVYVQDSQFDYQRLFHSYLGERG